MQKLKTIRKAIFPVAGLGTRFLPATKANPKEMMPVVDKPLIQYAVEEAIEAGIEELIFVTSSSKRAIEDHFDSHFELETRLKEQGKEDLLQIVQNILPQGVSCVYIRQPEAKGLGHAILCAKNVIGDEPFAVLLADDLIDCQTNEKENSHARESSSKRECFQNSCLKQMISKFLETPSSIIAVEKIKKEDSDKYGIISSTQSFQHIGLINKIVEKPKPIDAPSDMGVVGRYILTPTIFKHLESLTNTTHRDIFNGDIKHSEIQLTDAIASLLQEEEVYAYRFQGKRYDCGNKLGYLQAVVSYGLKHPEVGYEFRKYLKQLYQIESYEISEIV